MADWELRHLAAAHAADPHRPDDTAYAAMVALVHSSFLALTWRERAHQVHQGPPCSPPCDLCVDIALSHAEWAANKVHRHLKAGPPTTHDGPVRDWITLLDWLTSADRNRTPVATVEGCLRRRLAADHPLLPLVLAVSTQLLPSAGAARGPRRMKDFVGDPRKRVLAHAQGWAVKPDRDLAESQAFATARQHHPRGCELLVQVLRRLDWGHPEPWGSVLDDRWARSGDEAALKALIMQLLSEEATREWFMRNVDARQSYNQDLRRRAYRAEAEVESLHGDPHPVP